MVLTKKNYQKTEFFKTCRYLYIDKQKNLSKNLFFSKKIYIFA